MSEPRGEQPLVEPMPGVAKRSFERLPFTGGEPIERDRSVGDVGSLVTGVLELGASRTVDDASRQCEALVLRRARARLRRPALC